jgi:predicted RNase H-like HicB family nuclease
MKKCTAVIDHCPDTGLYVGYVPGFPGAHSQVLVLMICTKTYEK